MAEASSALHTAIKAALTTAVSPTLVHDEAPASPSYPYVQVGDDTAVDAGTKTDTSQEFTVTIHCWARSATGMADVKTLQGQIYDAIHQADLTLTGFTVSVCRFDFSDSFWDSDGITRHGVSRFRIITTPV